MICIRPLASFFDRVRGSLPLSTRMTMRIQCSATLEAPERFGNGCCKQVDSLSAQPTSSWLRSFGMRCIRQQLRRSQEHNNAQHLPDRS